MVEAFHESHCRHLICAFAGPALSRDALSIAGQSACATIKPSHRLKVREKLIRLSGRRRKYVACGHRRCPGSKLSFDGIPD